MTGKQLSRWASEMQCRQVLVFILLLLASVCQARQLSDIKQPKESAKVNIAAQTQERVTNTTLVLPNKAPGSDPIALLVNANGTSYNAELVSNETVTIANLTEAIAPRASAPGPQPAHNITHPVVIIPVCNSTEFTVSKLTFKCDSTEKACKNQCEKCFAEKGVPADGILPRKKCKDLVHAQLSIPDWTKASAGISIGIGMLGFLLVGTHSSLERFLDKKERERQANQRNRSVEMSPPASSNRNSASSTRDVPSPEISPNPRNPSSPPSTASESQDNAGGNLSWIKVKRIPDLPQSTENTPSTAIGTGVEPNFNGGHSPHQNGDRINLQ